MEVYSLRHFNYKDSTQLRVFISIFFIQQSGHKKSFFLNKLAFLFAVVKFYIRNVKLSGKGWTEGLKT